VIVQRARELARDVASDLTVLARTIRRPLDVVALLLFVSVLAGGVVAVVWSVRYALAVNRLASGVGDVTFYGADGRPWFRLDERRRDVPLEQISPYLQEALIATEDRRFYYHPGIDPVGLLRAVRDNVRRGEAVEGASTLTQQLARTLFLSNVRTVGRKGKEAVIALMLEVRLTKSQILELYLNRVFLSAGVYGVEAMSTSLFGKHASDLTLAEAALIAGLVKAPSALSPWSNFDGAVRRSDHVLARMRAVGFITDADLKTAKQQRLKIRPYPALLEARYGYAKEYLRQQFRDRFGGDQPPDWEVHTTMLPALQDIAEQSVTNGLARIGIPDLQAALVALDPDTGHVLAIVGGRDFRVSPFNRAARSRRQPGSAFKPFVYAVALQRGMTPATVLQGLTALAPQGQEEWTPRNVSGEIEDRLTLRQAFFESNNRAAVALQQKVGTRPVLRLASSLGVPDQPDVPSLALGTGLVTPLQLTAAYAAFPNGGNAVAPHAILRVVDDAGGIALEESDELQRAMPEGVAFQVVSLMTDVIDRGTGTAVRSWGVRFPVAGKTGTTNDFKDAWFMGYSQHLVAGVWVGFDQPATIRNGASGARVALPIWAEFMRRASRLVRPGAFAPPDGMRAVELCRISYLRPVDGCPIYTEYFKAGDDVPSAHCQIHGGNLRQKAERVIERVVGGLLVKLWSKIKGQ
jgi:1A family penicillin-binding protein